MFCEKDRGIGAVRRPDPAQEILAVHRCFGRNARAKCGSGFFAGASRKDKGVSYVVFAEHYCCNDFYLTCEHAKLIIILIGDWPIPVAGLPDIRTQYNYSVICSARSSILAHYFLISFSRGRVTARPGSPAFPAARPASSPASTARVRASSRLEARTPPGTKGAGLRAGPRLRAGSGWPWRAGLRRRRGGPALIRA